MKSLSSLIICAVILLGSTHGLMAQTIPEHDPPCKNSSGQKCCLKSNYTACLNRCLDLYPDPPTDKQQYECAQYCRQTCSTLPGICEPLFLSFDSYSSPCAASQPCSSVTCCPSPCCASVAHNPCGCCVSRCGGCGCQHVRQRRFRCWRRSRCCR